MAPDLRWRLPLVNESWEPIYELSEYFHSKMSQDVAVKD